MNEAQRAVLDKALAVAGKRLSKTRREVVKLQYAGFERSTRVVWAQWPTVVEAFSRVDHGSAHITVSTTNTETNRTHAAVVCFVSDFDMLVETIVETWDATVALATGVLNGPGEFDAIEALLELREFRLLRTNANRGERWSKPGTAVVEVSREAPGVTVYAASGEAWAVSMLHPALPQVIELLDKAKEDEDADD